MDPQQIFCHNPDRPASGTSGEREMPFVSCPNRVTKLFRNGINQQPRRF